MRNLHKSLKPLGVIFIVATVSAAIIGLGHTLAQADSSTIDDNDVCRILMTIDRSGSVGQDPQNLSRIEGQIDQLFSTDSTTGLANPTWLSDNHLKSIQLGFWTFSSVVAANGANYDSPYMPYVDLTAASAQRSFENAFSYVTTGGGTDYEQGLSFDNYAISPQSQYQNPDGGIRNLANNADVLVFITDGVPNTPSDASINPITGDGYSDNNALAINAASAAYNQLVVNSKKDPKPGEPGLIGKGHQLDKSYQDGYGNTYYLTYGIMVGSDSTSALQTSLRLTNPTVQLKSVTDFSGDGLSSALHDTIQSGCGIVGGPPPPDNYSLSPVVKSNSTVTTSSATATFNYNVDSTLPSGSSTNDSTDWTIDKLVIPKGVSTSALMFGQSSGTCGYDADSSKVTRYCDGINGCDSHNGLVAKLGGAQSGLTCTPAVSGGNNSFPHGSLSLDEYAGDAKTATIDNGQPIGTKVCYVLVLTKPTPNANTLNRASPAACIVLGKKPTVQITGGDVRVGRNLNLNNGSNSDNESTPAEINTSTTTRKNQDGTTTTYGSWVEYGAMAPGKIANFASGSGLSGGNSDSNQGSWSKLTFANAQYQYGYFTESNIGQGTIPDYASAILATKSVAVDLSKEQDPTSLTVTSTSQSGVYQNTSNDVTVTLKENDGDELGKNQTIILNVPNGTVKIASDIAYSDGPYTSISQIPQLIIIAKTINIDPSVSHVDAWLIADNANDGTISTCDDPATLTVNVCNEQLTINGPVIAHHLSLRRTAGANNASDAATAAEVINMPGTTYLWSQNEGLSDVRAQTTLTTELPPYF